MQLLPAVFHHPFFSFVKLQGCSSTSTRCQRFVEHIKPSAPNMSFPLVPVSPIPTHPQGSHEYIIIDQKVSRFPQGQEMQVEIPGTPQGHGTPRHPYSTPIRICWSIESYMGPAYGKGGPCKNLWIDGGEELGDVFCIFYSVGRK